MHRPPDEERHDREGDDRGQPGTAGDIAHRAPDQALARSHRTQRGDPDRQTVRISHAAMILGKHLFVDLLERTSDRERAGRNEEQTGDGTGIQPCRRGPE